MTVLGGQWSEMGPGEARKRHSGQPTSSWAGNHPLGEGPKQGQLFNPDKLPQIPAHHQTPEQFANDPRTWWHGRFMGAKTKTAPNAGAKEGFHAGTLGAANIRLEHNANARGISDDSKRARLIPLRLTGKMGTHQYLVHPTTQAGATPEQPAPDRKRHYNLGQMGHGYFYENQVEDPGHISVGVPRRKGFLSTHKEMVDEAKSKGDYVHPLISWAVKKAPAHTGEESPPIAGKRAARDEMLGSYQHHQNNPTLSDQQFAHTMPGFGSTLMERRRVPTEGGAAMTVWRKRGGSALEPHEWEGKHDWS